MTNLSWPPLMETRRQMSVSHERRDGFSFGAFVRFARMDAFRPARFRHRRVGSELGEELSGLALGDSFGGAIVKPGRPHVSFVTKPFDEAAPNDGGTVHLHEIIGT